MAKQFSKIQCTPYLIKVCGFQIVITSNHIRTEFVVTIVPTIYRKGSSTIVGSAMFYKAMHCCTPNIVPVNIKYLLIQELTILWPTMSEARRLFVTREASPK